MRATAYRRRYRLKLFKSDYFLIFISYMLINISSDHLYIYQDNQKILVPRWDLETNLPRVMHKLLSWWDFSSKKLQIHVINGPWSFTNLRVGCLVCNTIVSIYKHTKNIQIELYDLSKMDFYSTLYNAGIVSRYGMIYIWQQKNYWKYDLDDMSWEKVNLSDYLHDGVIDLSDLFDNWNYRVDEVWDRDFLHEIGIDLYEDKLIFSLDDSRYELDMSALGWKKVEKLIPNYLLEPNIWAGKI